MGTRMSAPLGKKDSGRDDAGSHDAGTTTTTGPGASAAATSPSSPLVAAVADRRCGRCQRPFPGDPALTFQTDWALCPDCSAILMPRPAASPS
jgi:hypothetical protein